MPDRENKPKAKRKIMKITIDLKDVHFQSAVTDAVRGKIEELCAVAMMDKINSAVQKLLGELDPKVNTLLSKRVDEELRKTSFGARSLAAKIQEMAGQSISKLVEEQFRKRFP